MDWPEELQEVRGELDALFRADPYLGSLGGQLDDWGLGWARAHLVPGPEHANIVGSVHGGVISALGDFAFEVACNSYGRVAVAAQLGCHYTSPGAIGEILVVEGEEVARSRRTASYRLTVRSETGPTRGKVVAWFMALSHRTARWHLGEERYPSWWREKY